MGEGSIVKNILQINCKLEKLMKVKVDLTSPEQMSASDVLKRAAQIKSLGMIAFAEAHGSKSVPAGVPVGSTAGKSSTEKDIPKDATMPGLASVIKTMASSATEAAN